MYEYMCKLERVVDGDTIDVKIDLGFDIHHSARVRMMGIDTPESRTRRLDEKALGLASKARLKELLKGKKIKLATSKEGKGKFGRVLADVITIDKEGSEINCNNQLIKEGHARPYFGGSKVPWV
jgi:micrococcal nuclease